MEGVSQSSPTLKPSESCHGRDEGPSHVVGSSYNNSFIFLSANGVVLCDTITALWRRMEWRFVLSRRRCCLPLNHFLVLELSLCCLCAVAVLSRPKCAFPAVEG